MRLSPMLLLAAPASALHVGAPTFGARALVSRSLRPQMVQAPIDLGSSEAQEPPEGSTLWVPDDMLQAQVEALPQVKKLLAANPSLGDTLKRAEFWSNETASVLEVVNVVGRWQKSEQIVERTAFCPESYRVETLAQSATWKRYKMATKLKCTERMGLLQNAKKLPFTDEKLAASVGLTVADFEDIPVTDAAANVVYDALAESRSGLIPYAVADARRAAWINDDGSVNLAAFKIGTFKSSFVVIASWFMFGKGNFVWILVFARALADVRPDLFAFLNPATEEGKVLWKAFAIL